MFHINNLDWNNLYDNFYAKISRAIYICCINNYHIDYLSFAHFAMSNLKNMFEKIDNLNMAKAFVKLPPGVKRLYPAENIGYEVHGLVRVMNSGEKITDCVKLLTKQGSLFHLANTRENRNGFLCSNLR